jgi:hypothetical protein
MSEVFESVGNMVSVSLIITAYFTIALKNGGLTELVELLRKVDESYQPTSEHTKAIDEKTRKLCRFWSVTFPKAGFVLFAFVCVVAGIDAFQARDIEHRTKYVPK